MKSVVKIIVSRIVLLLLVVTPSSLVYGQHSALLFGASGAVGSEVLTSLLETSSSSSSSSSGEDDGKSKGEQAAGGTDPSSSSKPIFWESVTLIGRKFPSKVDDIIQNAGSSSTNVTKISLPDLIDIDQNEELLNQLSSTSNDENIDACFICIGIGNINEVTLEEWKHVEVDMIASITNLCNAKGARYISLLSAVDTEDYNDKDNNKNSVEEPFTDEEMKDKAPLGWWNAIQLYYRMKGLSEKAVIETSQNNKSVTYIHLFRPSTIVTPTTRYGWIDYFLFPLHKLLDPILPTRYHSISSATLGKAMVVDAMNTLKRNLSVLKMAAKKRNNVKTLTYQDIVQASMTPVPYDNTNELINYWSKKQDRQNRKEHMEQLRQERAEEMKQLKDELRLKIKNDEL